VTGTGCVTFRSPCSIKALDRIQRTTPEVTPASFPLDYINHFSLVLKCSQLSGNVDYIAFTTGLLHLFPQIRKNNEEINNGLLSRQNRRPMNDSRFINDTASTAVVIA
jgi:hypothetical protein